MMDLSVLLVFALNILGAQIRAQSPPLGDCVCTPFYACFDEETSSSLLFVDDRANFGDLPVSTVISARQESDPNACQDILDVCCYKLTPQPLVVNPTSSSPSIAPQSPVVVQPEEEILADLPTTCTGDRPLPRPEAGCGVRNPCGVDFAFSGFKEGQAQYGEFPWMVAVLTSNTGFGADMGATNLFVGGGSLIHPQVVLTSAHKVQEHQNKIITARVGEWNFASTSEPTNHTDIRVREVIIHPRFDATLKIYNVALLVLERPAILGETVRTICLASNPNGMFDGMQNCIVSGWGKDVFGETGRYQRILKSVTVNVVERIQCQSALRTTRLGSSFELHTGFTCAGDKGQDACTGDGGGPLVCPHPTSPGQYVQVGVAAWGIGCGEQGLPGVYWGIDKRDWIDGKLGSLDKI